jgi:hypothetical protein
MAAAQKINPYPGFFFPRTIRPGPNPQTTFSAGIPVLPVPSDYWLLTNTAKNVQTTPR